MTLDRAAFLALDADDPLRAFRERFAIPDGCIYLDGNSLGPRPVAALDRASHVVGVEWGVDLIKSWNTAGWFELPTRLGDKLAPLIAYLDSLTGRADLATLHRLLAKANITRADVESSCIFGARGYKRNTIARSEHYELLAICWRSGHCTPIHDHRQSSCAFRVVEGIGTEIRFKVTESSLICPTGTHEMRPGYICAAQDADIHQISNLAPAGEDLVTLHVYSPPLLVMGQ